MIKIKPEILYVKDPDTGEFKPLIAIKGAPGSVDNIDDYFVNETGDSELHAMTQKGVTAIKTDLESSIVDTKTELEESISEINTQIEGVYITENLLDTAALIEDPGVYNFHMGTDFSTEADLPNGYCKWSTATLFVRTKNAKVLVLWGNTSSTGKTYINRYGSVDNNSTLYKWHGWQELISSKTIGEQSVAEAAKAESVNCVRVSSLADINGLVTQKKSCPIYFTTDITIDNVKFPIYSQGMLHSGNVATISVVADNGVIYTAFYNDGQDRWYGARKSSHADTATTADSATTADKTTCITKLPHYTSPEMIENGGIYPPTANAVQDVAQDIYWAISELSERISNLEQNRN